MVVQTVLAWQGQISDWPSLELVRRWWLRPFWPLRSLVIVSTLSHACELLSVNWVCSKGCKWCVSRFGRHFKLALSRTLFNSDQLSFTSVVSSWMLMSRQPPRIISGRTPVVPVESHSGVATGETVRCILLPSSLPVEVEIVWLLHTLT